MFSRFLGLFTSRGIRSTSSIDQTPAPAMTSADRAAVLRLANGHEQAHEQAVAAYRSMLERGASRDTPEMMFMHEVDHSNPDPVLKSLLRHRLLSAVTTKA